MDIAWLRACPAQNYPRALRVLWPHMQSGCGLRTATTPLSIVSVVHFCRFWHFWHSIFLHQYSSNPRCSPEARGHTTRRGARGLLSLISAVSQSVRQSHSCTFTHKQQLANNRGEKLPGERRYGLLRRVDMVMFPCKNTNHQKHFQHTMPRHVKQ